jgi:hypothetical protein
MATSAVVMALDAVQAAVASLLLPLGFRRRGRTFNRSVGDGLVHVVNLEMGGIPESLDARFTANLGVFIPSVHQLQAPRQRLTFVREYFCEIRTRLSALAGYGDKWWDLDGGECRRARTCRPAGTCCPAGTAAQIQRLLDAFDVPFLDQYETYDDVVEDLCEHSSLPGVTECRSALVGALVCHASGRREDAREWFDKAAAGAGGFAGFEAFVERIREKCGV